MLIRKINGINEIKKINGHGHFRYAVTSLPRNALRARA